MFANFVLLYLSHFKLGENFEETYRKIYLSTFSFSTLILHQFSQCNFVRIATFFILFACVLGCYFLELG